LLHEEVLKASTFFGHVVFLGWFLKRGVRRGAEEMRGGSFLKKQNAPLSPQLPKRYLTEWHCRAAFYAQSGLAYDRSEILNKTRFAKVWFPIFPTLG